MRAFLPLGPIVAILVIASCGTVSRVYSTGGGGSSAATTMTSTGSGGNGVGGMETSSSTTSSGGCVPKTCTELGLQCGSASDGCTGMVDCGFCPTGEVCGASLPNVCGISAACSSYASNVCSTYDACAPDVVTYLYGSVAACESRYSLLCSLLVSEPQTSWTQTQEQSCGVALANLGCQAFLLSPFTGGPATCQPEPGPRVTGAGCIDSGQCASAYCKHIATSFCGTCVARAAVGGVCDTFLDCQAGLACVSGACATALTTGQLCTTGGDQCALGLYCQAGICQPPVELNGSCAATGAVCNVLEGLYCNTVMHTCLRAVGYAAAGQPCGIVSGMVEGCTAAATCNGTTCTAPAADGAACNTANQVGCTNPAACLDDVCTLGTPTTCP
jgi:hypothetical protein